jgi:hypothetical protein
VTQHRRTGIQSWVARVLVAVFVLSGAAVGVGRAAEGAAGSPILRTGARSVPWAPLALGSVGVDDALTAGVTGGSTPLPRAAATLPSGAPAPRLQRGVPASTRAAAGPESEAPATVSAHATPPT